MGRGQGDREHGPGPQRGFGCCNLVSLVFSGFLGGEQTSCCPREGAGARLTARSPRPLPLDILNYYFLCNQAIANPFQQVRAGDKGNGHGGTLNVTPKGGGQSWGLGSWVSGEEQGAGAQGPVSQEWRKGQQCHPQGPPSSCLPAEADSVPESPGQHPLTAAGPGAGSSSPVPICTGLQTTGKEGGEGRAPEQQKGQVGYLGGPGMQSWVGLFGG